MKEKFSEKEFENIVKRYESILENIPETIYSSLPDEIGSTIFLSKKLEDWTGFDSETFLKDPNHWIKTIHPLDRNKVLKQYNEAKNKKSEFLLEYRLINKNSGDIIYIKDHGVPVFNNNGKLMRYDGVMTNITDIVLKDKKLKESEEKYHHLFENSPYVVGLFNFEGILLDVNEKANDFVSLHNVKDLIGLHFTEIWEFNKKNKFLIPLYNEKFEELKNSGKVIEWEYPVHQILGGIKWFHVSASLLELENEKLIQLFLRDITETKYNEKKLKESNEIFEIISRQSFVSIIILQDDVFKYFNDVFLEITGYKREEVENWEPGEFLKIIHPKDRDFVIEQAKKKQNGDKSIIKSYNCRGIKKNKENLWVRLYSKTVTYNDKFADLIILLDITERKNTEKKLMESEKKYRTIFNNASDVIMIHDLSGKILEANQVLEKRLGYSSSEIVNLKPIDFVSEKFVNDVPERIKKTLKKGQMFYESEHVTKYGKKIPVEINLKVIKYNGKTAFLNISRDITERKKAERKLKESEEKFRTIADQSAIGIVIFQNKEIKYLNQAYANILEYPIDEIKNWTYEDLRSIIYKKDLSLANNSTQDFEFNPEVPIMYTCRIVTSKKKIKWVETNLKLIKFQNKDSILVSLIDVTQQKKAENNLRKISKLKTELLRRTSHELKTPLVSIKGFSDLLIETKADKFDKETVEIVEEIRSGTERLEDLVQDILDAAILESNKVEITKNKENLSFLISYSIKTLEPIAKSRNQEIIVNIHDNLVTYFEKEKIFQVLQNLISNSIKYTPPNGIIRISTKIDKKNSSYIVAISDTGIGLDEEDKKQLFTQFGKIERYGSGLDIDIEGSGLGLYISKELIKLHGGKIWVESKGRNKGSTFYFSLPIIKKGTL